MRPTVVYRTVGLAAALAGTALVAQQLMTVLLAGLVTIILSLPLCAAASLAERHGAPRAVGAAGALIAGVAVLAGLGFAVIPSFISQVKQFAQRLPVILASADRYVHGLSGKKTHSLSAQLNGFVQGYLHHPDRLVGPVEHIGLTVLGILLMLLLIILGAFLIALNPSLLVNGFLRLVPEARRAAGRRCDGPCSDRVARLDDRGGARHAGARWLVVHRAGDHRAQIRDRLCGVLRVHDRDPELRLSDQRDPPNPRRLGAVTDEGAAGADRLPDRQSDRGEPDPAADHGPHRRHASRGWYPSVCS